MVKKSKKKKKSLFLKGLILIIGIGAVFAAITAFKGITQAEETFSFLAARYQASLERVEKLINDFPADIFQDPFLDRPEHAFKLPLKADPGKENPFKLPTPPEELLLLGL